MRSFCLVLLLASISHAAHVYLSPSLAVPTTLPSDHANAVLSHQFGLEFLDQQSGLDQSNGQELLGSLYSAGRFVGRGQKNGLLLTVDEVDEKGPYAVDVGVSIHL
jgi:hypothetical protein